MSEQIEALLKRAERAEQRREQFRGLMQDIASYDMPERDAWNSYGIGQQRNTECQQHSMNRTNTHRLRP
jgi:hypothetical protein